MYYILLYRVHIQYVYVCQFEIWTRTSSASKICHFSHLVRFGTFSRISGIKMLRRVNINYKTPGSDIAALPSLKHSASNPLHCRDKISFKHLSCLRKFTFLGGPLKRLHNKRRRKLFKWALPE